MDDEKKIPLADVIQDLRSEIVEAMRAAETAPGGKDLRFELEAIQLELQVAVTRTGEGKTKAKFWVLDFEVGGEVAKAETQKVVLSLKPERVQKPGEGEEESSPDGDKSVYLRAPVKS